jgi:hypothetical protein
MTALRSQMRLVVGNSGSTTHYFIAKCAVLVFVSKRTTAFVHSRLNTPGAISEHLASTGVP